MDGLPAHDVALLLDEAAGVMVRSGQHCVHSWFADRGHPQGSFGPQPISTTMKTMSDDLWKH